MPKEEIQNIEKLHILKELQLSMKRLGIPHDKYKPLEEDILRRIEQPENVIRKRLRGLEKEDEFHLLAIALGNVDSITRLDQRQKLSTNDIVIPDFLVNVRILPQFDPKRKKFPFLVEVKKNKEGSEKFVVSPNYLRKLERYAKSNGIPLFFAIKWSNPVFQFWTLVPSIVLKGSRERRNRSLYLGMLDAINHDYMGFLLANSTLIVPKGLKVRKLWSKSQQGFLQDEELGFLVEHEISFDEKSFKVGADDGKEITKKITSSTIMKLLARGEMHRHDKKDFTETVFISDANYFLPLYWVVIEGYLRLRKQFQPVLGKPAEESVSYYLDNFTELDRNIIWKLHGAILRLEETGVIQRFLQLPSEFFPDR